MDNMVDNTNPNIENIEVSSTNIQPLTLTRQAFNKEKFYQTIDTSFTQLGVDELDLSFFDPNLVTQGDFFSIYRNSSFIR